MQLDTLIKSMIRDEIAAMSEVNTEPPEFIKIEEARKICQCDRSVIDSLISESHTNGFPSIRLSDRVIRIDKHRLLSWLASGGLDGSYNERG